MTKMMHSRRQFLRTTSAGAAAVGIGSWVPDCLAQAAHIAESDERILVVIQLAGGNDGLNTVVPYSDDAYYAARPKLGQAKSALAKLDDTIGLHPALKLFSDLVQDGLGAIVQAVGYEKPNRSHFESMDIWHTCKRKDQPRPDGWLGRFLDAQEGSFGGDVPALHLGHESQPLAVRSREIRVPTVSKLEEFQLQGSNREALQRLLAQGPSATSTENGNDLLAFMQSSTTAAVEASQRVSKATENQEGKGDYPDSALGQKLQTVGQLIRSGMKTRVYYMQLDGFDTHSQQPDTHAILLREWSEAVAAFTRALKSHDLNDRVCLMTFSEFGRRVAENASEGTDHGAAGPMFFCGGGLGQPIIGDHPSLTDLQDGDLKHAIDFRQVYAAVLKDWLRVDPEPVLGQAFDAIPLFKG